jgi:hypothetical protein
MDPALLARLFPIMKGAFNYLWHLARKDGSGVIHVDNSGSPEYPGATSVNDANYTLSLFKWLAGAVIEADNRLGLGDAIVGKCQDVLQHLAPYPTDGNGFMVGAAFPFTQSHRHWSHLFMIYPLFEYTWENPAQATLAETSVNWWNGLSSAFRGYSYVAGMTFATMKGDRTTALSKLNTFLNGQPTANTMYRETSPVIETPLFFARGVQELMLMSHGGIIRVFPGAPSTWSDVAFDRFRAEGAFLVSAKRKAGVTKFVRVESLAGEPCKVKHGMSGTVKAWGARGFTVTDLGGGVVQVDLQAGEAAVLYTDATLPDLTVAPVALPDRVNFWGVNTTVAPAVAGSDFFEAEAGALSGAVAVRAAGAGASGDGWAEYVNASGDAVSWTVPVAASGTYGLTFRQANASAAAIPLQIEVNGAVINPALSFPVTASATPWDVVSLDASLPAGSATITARATGSGGPRLDNLEVIPRGSTSVLLSQGKPATASTTDTIGGYPSKAVDGDLTTRWGASSSAYPQWWRVDLGATKTIKRVDAAWFNSASRAYKYRIETSTDGTTYTIAVDKTANTTYGDTSNSFTATARYVRMYITGATAGWASAYEFKVFGY